MRRAWDAALDDQGTVPSGWRGPRTRPNAHHVDAGRNPGAVATPRLAGNGHQRGPQRARRGRKSRSGSRPSPRITANLFRRPSGDVRLSSARVVLTTRIGLDHRRRQPDPPTDDGQQDAADRQPRPEHGAECQPAETEPEAERGPPGPVICWHRPTTNQQMSPRASEGPLLAASRSTKHPRNNTEHPAAPRRISFAKISEPLEVPKFSTSRPRASTGSWATRP